MSESCPRCDAPLAADRTCVSCLTGTDPEISGMGDSLDMLDVIGSGGMGTVHRAYHRRLDRDVAVKILRDELAADPVSNERFQREARALARLDHPGIVRVHDFALAGGKPYLVMELVEGSPLSERLPMTADDFMPILEQLVEALAHAHDLGIVHRDIKPANVLVTPAGRVKVSDFGIARLIGPGGRGWTLTSPDAACGTVAYMSPEALRGAEPDPRMDLFSLGVLCHEALTGRLPIGSLGDMPQGLSRAVARALSPEAGARHAGVRDFLRDVRGERVTDVTMASTPSSPGVRLVPPAPDPRRLDTDDRNLIRGLALILVATTATGLWAVVTSLTPRILDPSDVHPLLMVVLDPLPGGKVVSRVRFEIWPALALVIGASASFAAWTMLRRHWSREGLLGGPPDPVLARDGKLLLVGAIASSLYALRLALESMGQRWLSVVIPVLGGPLEFLAFYLFWVLLVEASRSGRSLAGAWKLWLGLVLALIPPAHNFLHFLWVWTPGS